MKPIDINERVWNRVEKQAWNKVRDQTSFQIRRQVETLVWIEIYEQIGAPISIQIHKELTWAL